MDEEALRRRWLNVVTMRGRQSNAPLAPRWGRFLELREMAIGWLDLMEKWEAAGYFGSEKPDEFEGYVEFYQRPLPPKAAG